MFKKELWILIIIHLKELIREPGVIFWGIGFPILMAWGLGIAFNNKPEVRQDVAIVETTGDSRLMNFLEQNAKASSSPDSVSNYTVIAKDTIYGKTTFRFIPVSMNQAIRGIKQGQFQLYLESPGDTVIYHLDPANPDARTLQLQITALMNDNNAGSNSQAAIIPMKLQGTRYVDFLSTRTAFPLGDDGLYVGN